MNIHPDAELIALCDRLAELQTEWQRLYDATSDGPDFITEADTAWSIFNDTVWPAEELARCPGMGPSHPGDLVGQLHQMRATTLDGMRAKARAILALEEAALYSECRNDACQLATSLIQDVAGIATHCLGADATHKSKGA